MFDINQRVNEIASTYEGYIPAQFTNENDTPKAKATLRFIIKVALASAIMDQLAICFSMEEASGKVLDIIAKNFGLSRNLPTPDYNIPFFQLPEYQDVSYIDAQDQYSTIDIVSITNTGINSITLVGIDGADSVPANCFTVKDPNGNEFCLETSVTIASGSTESLPVFRSKYIGAITVNAGDTLTRVSVLPIPYSTIDAVSLTNIGLEPITLVGIDGSDTIPDGCFTVKDSNNAEFYLENSLTIPVGATESLVVFRAKSTGAITVTPGDALTQVTVVDDLSSTIIINSQLTIGDEITDPITVNSQLTTGDDLGTTPDFVGYTDYSTTTNYDSVFRRYSSSDSQNINTPDAVLKQIILFKVLAGRCKGSLEDIITLLKSTGLDNSVSITDGMNRTIIYRVSTTDSILASIIFSLNLFPRPIGIESTLVVVSNPLGIFHFLAYGGSPLGFCFNAYGSPLNGRGWLKYGDVQFNP